MDKDSSGKIHEPIAVIGVGCMFPDARNLQEYWANIVKGHDAIKEIPLTHWRPEDYFHADPKKADHTYAQTGGFLRPYDFDPLQFGIAPHAIEATDTSQLLGMVCAHQALLDAGYGPDKPFDRERTSCIVGVTGTLELVIPLGARLGHPIWKKALKDAAVPDDVAAQVMDDIANAYVPWQENSFPGLLGNVVAGRIANRLDLGGSNSVVDAACASSLAALHMAMMELDTHRADMVITGGMDTFNDIFMYMCFSKTPALSPSGHSRPFDAEGDGTILGEGLGAIILKRLADAERDGDRIYAVIRGLGSSSDGKGQAVYAPSAKGQVKALRRAYAAAELPPESIELVEGHGTGTKVGDGVELEALAQLYPETAHPSAVLGSVKSQIGHTKAAAGAAGLIKCVMALHHRIQPPTLKVRSLHKNFSASRFEVLDKARPWVGLFPRRAAVSAFGFGGSNYHCVVEEYASSPKPLSWDDEVHLWTWSADSEASLVERVAKSQAELLQGTDPQRLGRRIRREFSADRRERLALWARGGEQLTERLEKVLAALREKKGLPPFAASGSGARSERLAFVFAGQGSQQPGMLRELALAFPEYLEALEKASAILKKHEPEAPWLVQIIYPGQVFREGEKEEQDERLRQTRYTQLSLAALEAATIKVLQRFGIAPSATAGHSFGELPALYAAGSVSLDELLEAAYARGSLMEKFGRPGASMLAVMASLARVESFLAGTGLTVANDNAPEQVVVGGSIEALQSLQETLKGEGIRSQKLNVSSAFHTAYVEDACKAYEDWLAEHVQFAPSKVTVYANREGAEHAGPELGRRLAAQIGERVHFRTMIERMDDAGIQTFLEVGPGRKLQGILEASRKAASVLSLDADPASSFLGLARALGHLAVLGHALDLTVWNPGPEEDAKESKFKVALSGANYRSPQSPKEVVRTKVEAQEKPRPPGGIGQEKSSSEQKKLPTVSQERSPAASYQDRAQNPRATVREGTMKKNWTELENLLRDMQEVQKKTADAHTLFLENQRQFQDLLRHALLDENAAEPPRGVREAREPVRTQAEARDDRRAYPDRSSLDRGDVPAASVRAQESHAAAADSLQIQSAAVKPEAKAPVSDSAHAILKVVADATGFPSEMLQESMHLEADLGIDSIKKVEIFSQLQALYPQLDADANRMNEVQTIAELIRYCAPDSSERQGAWSASPVAFVAHAQAKPSILSVISDKTGFPVEMLEDGMDLESDLGVDSIKKVEIFSALQESLPALPADALHELRTIGDILTRYEGYVAQDAEHAAAIPAANRSAAPRSSDPQKARQLLWAVVAEKTGYPEEVLSPDMDLEGDLGIDSIKRVEILSALGERFPSLQTQDLNIRTLGDLLQLLGHEETVEALLQPGASDWDLSVKKKADEPPSVEPLIAAEASLDEPFRGLVEEQNAEALEEQNATAPVQQDAKPHDEDDAKASADVIAEALSGTSLGCWKLRSLPFKAEKGSIAWEGRGEVWIVDDGSNLARNLMLKLQERGKSAKLISLASSDRLAIPDNLQGLFLLAPLKFDHIPLRWLQAAFRLIRRIGAELIQTKEAREGQAFVVTISRHGGHFGLDGLSQLTQVYAGAITAFTKTIAQEWTGVHARSLDLGRDFVDGFEAALRCIEAAFLIGPVEIGVQRDRNFTLLLEEENLRRQDPEKALNPQETVLVTGGARGVTAATLLALAKRYPVRFVIWGRSEAPGLEDPDFHDIKDAASVKRLLLQKNPALKHPRDLESAYKNLLAQRELRSTFEQLKKFGAQVAYERVDVSRDAELREAFQNLKARGETIAGVIHGAGVIRDHLLIDQSDEELNAVLETKLRILPQLESLAQSGTRWMIFFSSSTARLGRKGQGAYALANEALNRMAAYLPQLGCRSLSLNWGPWDGGMVHDGLKQLFASEGLGTIPLRAGAELQTYLLEESALGSGEWLILGQGGREVLGSNIVHREQILKKWTVRIDETPILLDHVIKQRAVVPAALLLEWMSGAIIQQRPDFTIQGVRGFHVWKGVLLDADQSVNLEAVLTSENVLDPDSVELECILRGWDQRPYAHAFIRLGLEAPALHEARPAPQESADAALESLNPYEDMLFHGENLHLIKKVLSSDSQRLRADLRVDAQPRQWSADLASSPWLTHAPLIDAVFQGMIVWSSLERNTRCLPSRIGKLEVFAPWKDGSYQLEIVIREASAHKLLADARIWSDYGQLTLVAEGLEATMDASLAESFRQRELKRSEPIAPLNL